MAKNQDKWGKDTARERYGDHTKTYPNAKDCSDIQGEADDKQGPKYDNDTPNDWRRGNGMKPGFDYGRK